MLFGKRASSAKKPNGGLGVVKSFFSLLILTAFVLGIVSLTKQLATLDVETFSSLVSPIAGLAGLDSSKAKKAAGEVAGEFVARLSETKIVEKPVVKLALLADSHNDNTMLKAALEKAAALNVDFIVYLGDYTDWGDDQTLIAAKAVMATTALPWYSLPGDHDIAQALGITNYAKVFGYPNETVVKNGITFVLFNNSANFTPLTKLQLDWFEQAVSDADFVLLSQPLYHPINDRVMGIVDGETNEAVRNQAEDMLQVIRSSTVRAVISADQHISSTSNDPVRKTLKHIVVGALTRDRNLQHSRFSLMSVLENNTFSVEDVLVQ